MTTQLSKSHMAPQAVENYARAHNLDPGTVGLDTVVNSEQGIEHWYSATANVSARSPIGQAFARAVKHDPYAAKIYAELDEPEKMRFRAAWAIKRDFEFKSETKLVRCKHAKADIDHGEWMTELQLMKELGGHEHAEVRQQAANYIKMARNFGSKFIVWNTWLEVEQVLYIKKLMTSTTSSEWESVSEGYVRVNIWEQSAMLGKAKKAYGKVHGMKDTSVTKEMLDSSDIGVSGYASLDRADPVASPAGPASVGTPSPAEAAKRGLPAPEITPPKKVPKKAAANSAQSAAEKDPDLLHAFVSAPFACTHSK